MQNTRWLRALTAVVALVFLVQSWAVAGTTGSISGVLAETNTGVPIAGAKVSAASPSQAASTTTDASGRFSFISLAPDTYVLSFEKQGYDPGSQQGITVQADQHLDLSLHTTKQLATIGRTTTRANTSLVRPGQTASVYSVNAAQQSAAAALGGGTNLNSAYSAIASVPGVVVPLGNIGWGQSIFIRGGDYTQTGNEVDGIPVNRAFDQYASSPLSSLGNQEVQVYTGNAPADAQAVGLAGYINQVIKSGTTPAFGSLQYGVGSPGLYNQASFEYGGATTNRLFSYYVATSGYSQQLRIVNQFNGKGYLQQSGFGSLYNFTATGCATAHPSVGCYANNSPYLGGVGLPFGPNGYGIADTLWGSQPSLWDRQSIVNLHFGIPHKKSDLRDDVQLLYNVGEDLNYPNTSMYSWGASLNDVLNNTVNGVPGAYGPVQPAYRDQWVYNGSRYAPLTAANLTNIQLLNFANSPLGRPIGANVDPGRQDGETTGFAITKLQYQHNFSDKAFARVYGYTLYSDRLDNGIVGLYQNFVGAFSPDYTISAHTRGVALTSSYQITPAHLLTFDAGYTTSNTDRWRNDVAAGSAGTSQVAYLVNGADPTAGCYAYAKGAFGGAATPVTCSKASGYVLPAVNATGTTLVPKGLISPTLAQLDATYTCGTGPCEYYVVNNGAAGALNTVKPKFFNAALGDTWKPTRKLSIDATLRTDTYSYDLQDTNTPGNQLFVNDYNAYNCVQGTSVVSITTKNGACPAGYAHTALTASSPNLTYADILQPRLGATYTLNANNVLRASYGRFTQPAETSAVQATNVQAGTPSASFYANFGFASFARQVEPAISYNADFSWEHQFNNDTSFKLTPFYRKTVNEFASIIVDPKTNFVALVNGQNRTASGVEFALTKGDFNRNGLAAQLAYTYTYAYNQYKTFSNGGSFVSGINSAITQFNAYTKTGGGAPCYAAGAADPTCAMAGTVANPYYNMQPGSLLDPNGKYFPYNQAPGELTGASASYLIPHVASLIVQYKKDRLKITPSFQFQAGSRYGSPLASFGVDPATCGALAGAASTAGDPRYSGPATGGAPYDASSCTGWVNIPDPYSGKFDSIGEFRQPNYLTANLQVSYDVNRFTLSMTAANVYSKCWGGSSVPWAIGGSLGCNYSNGLATGNFYNPGDTIQNGFQYPYSPTLAGALQTVATASANPFQLYFNVKYKL